MRMGGHEVAKMPLVWSPWPFVGFRVRCIRICLKNIGRKKYCYIRIWSAEPLHRCIDPDLGLNGTFGDRFQLDQEHIFDLHEPLTNFPSLVGGSIDSVRLSIAVRFLATPVMQHDDINSQSSSLSTAQPSWQPVVRACCDLLGHVSSSSSA